MVWIPLFLDPSDGVFGRFDLAALCGCRTLNFLFVCYGQTWLIHCLVLFVKRLDCCMVCIGAEMLDSLLHRVEIFDMTVELMKR